MRTKTMKQPKRNQSSKQKLEKFSDNITEVQPSTDKNTDNQMQNDQIVQKDNFDDIKTEQNVFDENQAQKISIFGKKDIEEQKVEEKDKKQI